MADAVDVPVTLEFDLSLRTDPLGARLRVGVPDAPSDESRQALLDGMEESLVGGEGNLVFQAVQSAHDQLDQYGATNDYDTESIKDSFDGVDVDRNRLGLTITWRWTHPAAEYYEFGTPDHPVEGNPLSFIYDDAPEEVRNMFPDTERVDGDPRVFFQRTNVSGLPDARWVRDSLTEFRRSVGQ